MAELSAAQLEGLAVTGARMETAARELDRLFGGNAHRWTLDGRKVTDEAAQALLSLHDYLNELTARREGLG